MPIQFTRGDRLTMTFTADTEAYRRVYLDTATNKLTKCGVTDKGIGTAAHAVDISEDDEGTVLLDNGPGTQIMIASGAITKGADVYAAADGKVAASGSVYVGQARTTCVDGDEVEVLPKPFEQGVKPFVIPMAALRATGTLQQLGNTAGTPTGAMGITAGSHGSASPLAVTESASGASVTNLARFELVVPPEYIDGDPITVRVRCRESAASTVGATINLEAHESDGGGGVGADICATDPQDIDTTFTDYDFTLTPTNVVAGDVIDCELTMVVNDTGGSVGAVGQIGKVTVLPGVIG